MKKEAVLFSFLLFVLFWGGDLKVSSAQTAQVPLVAPCADVESTFGGARVPSCLVPGTSQFAQVFGSGAVNVGYYGLACDGKTNDGVAFARMMGLVENTTVPVTLVFSGTCVVPWGNYVITGAVSLEGSNGGGIKLTSGGTMSGALFKWQGAIDGVNVRNLSINLNNNSVSATGVTSVLNFNTLGGPTIAPTNVTIEDNHIFNAGALAAGATFEEVFGFGVNVWKVHHNTFQINTATAEANEAFDAGSQASPITDLDFSDNILINTGMGLFGAAGRTTITNNRVTGWGFGAAITAETVGYVDTNVHNVVISGNSLSNSLAVPDRLGTKLDAIETGFAGTVIANNSIYKTCGVGIGIYGPYVSITGNQIGDAGTCNVSDLYNSAIGVFAPAASAPAGQAIVDGNLAYEDGGGNTKYILSDVQNVSSIGIGTNYSNGLLSGAYNLSGEGVQFLHPQLDNRLVNPCFQIDQRNAGTTAVSGFVADQWRVVETAGNIGMTTQTAQTGQCYFYMLAQVSTQTTPASTDTYSLQQAIALQDIRDLGYASIYARDAVLGFCAKYSGSPPFTTSVFVQNINATMTWTQPFTITALANTLQCFSFIVPADYSDSLGVTPTNVAERVGINLGTGSSKLSSAPGTWSSGLSFGSVGDTALVSQSVGTNLKLSDFRYQVAGADQGWAPPKYADMLANAQRYYQTSFPVGTKPAQNAGLTGAACTTTPVATAQPNLRIQLSPNMATSPSITTFNPSATNANWRDVTDSTDAAVTIAADGTSLRGFTIGASATAATAGAEVCIHYTADAGLQ